MKVEKMITLMFDSEAIIVLVGLVNSQSEIEAFD